MIRWIEFDGCENFRDLGGHLTSSGRQVRYGLLYRSDTLECLSGDDHERFAALGIATVIDLRATSEIAKRGRLDPVRQQARYVHLPLVDVVGSPTAWDPIEASRPDYPILGYQAMLASGGERLAETLRVLAQQDALPAVFHCISGKDRTGLITALILSLLGVPQQEIATEYSLSDGRNRHSSASPELKQRYPLVFGAPAQNMLAVLAGIDDQHGSVDEYVRSLGVEPDDIERLRNVLLTDVCD